VWDEVHQSLFSWLIAETFLKGDEKHNDPERRNGELGDVPVAGVVGCRGSGQATGRIVPLHGYGWPVWDIDQKEHLGEQHALLNLIPPKSISQ
jgi:hypothetical protein